MVYSIPHSFTDVLLGDAAAAILCGWLSAVAVSRVLPAVFSGHLSC